MELGELVVDAEASRDLAFRGFEQTLETFRVLLLDHAETRLVAHVVDEPRPWRAGVESQRVLAFADAARIPAVERPGAAGDRELLLLETESEIVAVGDA